MSAARDGGIRRVRSVAERQRIVDEALAPGTSVAAVARRHGVNANLVFKWIRRSREGWLDRRRALSQGTSVAPLSPEAVAPMFVPVKMLELSSAPSPETVANPTRSAPRRMRRGAMEISLPNGARVSLDADVDAEALRLVLSALGAV